MGVPHVAAVVVLHVAALVVVPHVAAVGVLHVAAVVVLRVAAVALQAASTGPDRYHYSQHQRSSFTRTAKSTAINTIAMP